MYMNDLVQFTGWEKGLYGTFRIKSLFLSNGARMEKIITSHEGDWISSFAMFCYDGYETYESVQKDLGYGLVFLRKEYSSQHNRSKFIYDVTSSSEGTEIKIAVPATGEEIRFEIYAIDSNGQIHLLVEREL